MYEDKVKERAHKPVLVREVNKALNLKKLAPLNSQVKKTKEIYIDATLGGGGHSIEIVKAGGFVFGIDDDSRTIEIARSNLRRALWDMKSSGLVACPTLEDFRACFKLVNGNFIEIDKLAATNSINQVSGILFDLGISTIQLTSKKRGFSFQTPDANLDMRINIQKQNVTAADLLNSLPKKKLVDLFAKVLPLNKSRKLAQAIDDKRKEKRYEKVKDLLHTIKMVFKGLDRKRKIDVSTLPFLALRMAVNSELENLKDSLDKAFELLIKNGRLVVISFHSGEDKIVKEYYKQVNEKGLARIITKKPIVPGFDEIKNNPLSRSAKMRVLEKL